MSWLSRKINNWLRSEERANECVPHDPSRYGFAEAKNKHKIEARGGTNITFYKATGGYVVECGCYDITMDRYEHQLYVVNDEEELGAAISKILTMEALRR